METKQEKFSRIADVRLPKAVKAIELLGNLSTRDYDPDKAQVDAMFDALYDAVDGVADRFGREGSEPATSSAEGPAMIDLREEQVRMEKESPNEGLHVYRPPANPMPPTAWREMYSDKPAKDAWEPLSNEDAATRGIMGDVAWALEVMSRDPKLARELLKRALHVHRTREAAQ